MPNFKGSVTGSGPYNVIQDAWNGFLAGLATGGVSIEGSTLEIEQPAPLPPPAAVDTDGGGSDVRITCPVWDPEAGVSYTLRYSDDGFATAITTYGCTPGEVVTVPNGYSPGRQFAIFANEVQGVPSSPLP
jgi:hypothetical protein